jgi:hypothetical protein
VVAWATVEMRRNRRSGPAVIAAEGDEPSRGASSDEVTDGTRSPLGDATGSAMTPRPAAAPPDRRRVRLFGYLWAYTRRHLVILRDNQGTEDYRCSSVDLDTGQEITLTGKAGVRSFVWRASRDYPAEMLFGVNERDRRYFDVVRIDVTTGASRLVFENPGFSGLLVDDTLSVRLAVRVRPDGSAEVVDLRAATAQHCS